MSARRKLLLLAGFPLLLSMSSAMSALPIEPTAKELLQEMQRRPVFFVPARVGWNKAHKQAPKTSLPFERYGPPATARAVRASLKIALVPDPIAMACLLFCAFSWRWIKLRKEQAQAELEVSVTPEALPEAA